MKWAHKKSAPSRNNVIFWFSFFLHLFSIRTESVLFLLVIFFHSSHSRNAVLKQIECVCRTGAFDKECNHFTSVIESLCECHDKSNFALQFDFKAKTVPVRHFALHVQTLFYFFSFSHRRFVEVFRRADNDECSFCTPERLSEIPKFISKIFVFVQLNLKSSISSFLLDALQSIDWMGESARETHRPHS